MAVTVAAVTYGSTPMSSRHVNAAGASVVQRREDERCCQRRLERHSRCLQVAHLADGDQVGVAPKDRAKPRLERHVRVRVHLDLVDAVEPVDGIFNGDDVQLRTRDVGQRGMDRRRLARPCRPRYEQGAATLCHRVRHDGARHDRSGPGRKRAIRVILSEAERPVRASDEDGTKPYASAP
jgi:hypothetical protein